MAKVFISWTFVLELYNYFNKTATQILYFYVGCDDSGSKKWYAEVSKTERFPIITGHSRLQVSITMKRFIRRNPKSRHFMEEVLTIGALFAAVLHQAVPEGTRYTDFSGFCLLWLLSLVLGACTAPRSKHTITTTVGIL